MYEIRGKLIFQDGTVYPKEGVLDLMDPALKTETGSRQVRMTFPNPARLILPGQFVRVKFHGASKTDAILVPQRAVQQGPKGPMVYVVGPGETVQVRDVRPGDWHANEWLIEEGLVPGDRVIVDGFQRVMPGQPVRPVPAGSDGAGPAAPAGQAQEASS